MADPEDRRKFESGLADALAPQIAKAQQSFESGRVFSWNEWTEETASKISPEIQTAFAVVFLMMLDDDSKASQFSSQWSQYQSRNIATGLASSISRELQSGINPDRTFARSRAGIIAATEITRTITQAEILAARLSSGGDASSVDGPPILNTGNVVALWQTERDASVCPICSPLHNTTADRWPEEYINGPPAHPNCRCWLLWATIAKNLAANS
jgi:hypothetical protein